MTFDSREKLLVDLLSFDEYQSSEQLSNSLLISTKTVYRMIKTVNELSEDLTNEKLILSEVGKGYILNTWFEHKNLSTIFGKTFDENIFYYLQLLFKYPFKVELANVIQDADYMSKSSLDRQLRKLKDRLSDYQLKLKWDNKQVWIEGDEVDVRTAITNLMSYLNHNTYLNEVELNVSKIDHHFIMSELQLIEDLLGQAINYPYDVNLYTHILMVLQRYREGNVEFIASQSPLTPEEQKLMNQNIKLVEITQKVTRDISKYLVHELHELENYFLFQNLYSLNIKQRNSSELDVSLAHMITTYYITGFYKVSALVAQQEEYQELYLDLYGHILPMLHRLKIGIEVGNVMLEEVKQTYPDSYHCLVELSDNLSNEFPRELLIPDSEICYMTLYFEKFQLKYTRKVKVLLLCSTGVGTSELLKVRLKGKFSNLDIVAVMSLRQLKKDLTILSEVDVIISSLHHIELDTVVPIINVSPILTERDMKKLEKFL